MSLRPEYENRAASSTGRGGAGNIQPKTESSAPTIDDFTTPTIKQATYTTGRGGSGNMAPNVDAESARTAQDVYTPAAHSKEKHGTYHWGRGGEGNKVTVGNGDRPQSKERSQSKTGEHRPSFGGLVDKGKELLGLNKDKKAAARSNEVAIE